MVATKIERHAAPLRQKVVRLLREDILEGILPPGKRILENSLCEGYGVSRTVIREALRQLESENLVTMLPGHGPIVTVLTEHDIEALYQVRSVLEGLAGELFALRASKDQTNALRRQLAAMEEAYLHGTVQSREHSKDEFYRMLLDGAANEVLSEQLNGVHTRIGLFRRFAFVDEKRVAMSMRELRRIVQVAAVERDPRKSRAACEHHIRQAGELAVMAYRQWRADEALLPDDEVG